MTESTEKPIGYDCRHGTYCRSNTSNDDLVVVKEYSVYEDGRREPGIRLIPNYKRPFYITKDGFRNHKDKKEWEDVKKLQKFTCTQRELTKAVARGLGLPGVSLPLKQLANNPYLYGTDVSSTSLIKHDYQKKWPDAIGTQATMSMCDIETDVVHGTQDIICLTLSFKDRIVTAVTKFFVEGLSEPEARIHEAFEKYLGKFKTERNIQLEIYIADDPTDAIKHVFKRAHEWKPDFLNFWNINFDMPKIISTLQKSDSILEDVFSDPKVPHEYRHFSYVEGPSQKVTQDGSVYPLHPADRWHVVKTPASFYMLDLMCLYKRLRTAKGQEAGGYGLDAVLKRNLNLGKLKFQEADGLSRLEWHRFMQSKYKAEYVVYNIFDCISVELLDEKNGDCSQAFSALAELSDFNDFKSNPRRIINDLHYFCEEQGLIVAACGTDVETELDKFVIGLKDWIVTLDAHMCVDNGIPLIKEFPNIRSLMRAFLADK